MRDRVGYHPAQFPSQDEIKQGSWEFLQKSFGTKHIATLTFLDPSGPPVKYWLWCISHFSIKLFLCYFINILHLLHFINMYHRYVFLAYSQDFRFCYCVVSAEVLKFYVLKSKFFLYVFRESALLKKVCMNVLLDFL